MRSGGLIGKRVRYGQEPGIFDVEDAADPIPAAIEWCESRTNAADLSTYTFSAVDIGDPHRYRAIIVGIFYTASVAEPDAVTIAGAVVTLPPSFIQRDVDSGVCFGPAEPGGRRGLARSWPLSAAPGPVVG